MALILVAAEKGGDKFGAVAVPPALEPNGLGIEFGPLLLRLDFVNIDVKVCPDEGAPLGEAVLIVPLRQSVRLYKFFIRP